MKKTVILGVTGCIAAYKTLEVMSILKKRGYNIKVIMTKSATEFVTPLSFETLSRNQVILGTFDKKEKYEVEHVSLAKEATVFAVVPATANIIAKIAHGVADDMLSTTALSMPDSVPKLIAPAMNTVMYEDEITQRNIAELQSRGYAVVEPDSGMLACGDVGKGHIADEEAIADMIDKLATPNPDYRGKRVLVTLGGTEEPIDPVRVITNKSSGKMGLAIADAVKDRGGEPVLVCGRVSVSIPKEYEAYSVKTTQEMHDKTLELLDNVDVAIMAAAPSDYRVDVLATSKIKADSLTLTLVKNPDIAAAVGERKGDKTLVVFAAETDDLIKNAVSKLEKKNADFIVANDVTMEGAGFMVDTNVATLIDRQGNKKESGLVTKAALAHIILDTINNGI